MSVFDVKDLEGVLKVFGICIGDIEYLGEPLPGLFWEGGWDQAGLD